MSLERLDLLEFFTGDEADGRAGQLLVHLQTLLLLGCNNLPRLPDWVANLRAQGVVLRRERAHLELHRVRVD